MDKKLLGVLKQIVETDALNTEDEFICNCIALWKKEKERLHLRNYKPSEQFLTEFTEHPAWYGRYAWWRYTEEDREEAIKEKYRYINALIQHLEEKLAGEETTG